MPRLTAAVAITALCYSDSSMVDRRVTDLVCHLLRSGLTLAGFLERRIDRSGRSRCDMLLEDLATGTLIPISEDRGGAARGCRLDHAALTLALAHGEQALAKRPDLLIVNKFGKTEAEGGGFRTLIATAVEAEVPVLVAVPWANIDPWRVFVGPFSVEHAVDALPTDPVALAEALGFVIEAQQLARDDLHGSGKGQVQGMV
jgi:nucleoside-triphosphatase THEP1